MSEPIRKYYEGIGLATESAGVSLRQAALGYLEKICGHDVARIIGEYPSSAIVLPNIWVNDLVVFGGTILNPLLIQERKRHMLVRYQVAERKGEFFTLKVRKKEPRVLIEDDGVGIEEINREGWASEKSPSNGIDIFKAIDDGVKKPERLELGLVFSPEFTYEKQLIKHTQVPDYVVEGASLIQADTISKFGQILRQHANPMTGNSSAILPPNFLVVKSIKYQPLTSIQSQLHYSVI